MESKVVFFFWFLREKRDSDFYLSEFLKLSVGS